MQHDQPEAEGAVLVSLDDATLLQGLATLRWHLDDLLDGQPPVLIVDISALSQLSSPTLAALLWAQRVCRGRGGHVVLRGANDSCHSVLAATGLLGLFGLRDQPHLPELVRTRTPRSATKSGPAPVLRALLRRRTAGPER